MAESIGMSATGAARAVRIPQNGVALAGDLVVSDAQAGVVLFAHGSGSGRHSPRNRAVAAALQRRHLSTLLMDLLTESEEVADARTGHLRFDIGLLAERLVAATEWLMEQGQASGGLGIFGASTGAAAALVAAARRPESVRTVVSRGGRPDLAGPFLPDVHCPTLLIVGERDEEVIELNRSAQARMSAETELVIVPGATHLFEERGALEAVASLAGEWFTRHLRSVDTP